MRCLPISPRFVSVSACIAHVIYMLEWCVGTNTCLHPWPSPNLSSSSHPHYYFQHCPCPYPIPTAVNPFPTTVHLPQLSLPMTASIPMPKTNHASFKINWNMEKWDRSIHKVTYHSGCFKVCHEIHFVRSGNFVSLLQRFVLFSVCVSCITFTTTAVLLQIIKPLPRTAMEPVPVPTATAVFHAQYFSLLPSHPHALL